MCLFNSYKPPNTETNPTLEDPTPDYMNLLGMIFSMCGLMLKVTSFSSTKTPVYSQRCGLLNKCSLFGIKTWA